MGGFGGFRSAAVRGHVLASRERSERVYKLAFFTSFVLLSLINFIMICLLPYFKLYRSLSGSSRYINFAFISRDITFSFSLIIINPLLI
jgi:hypothetical protein